MINEGGIVECSCLSGNDVDRGAEHAPGELSSTQGARLGKLGGWREMSWGLSEAMSLTERAPLTEGCQPDMGSCPPHPVINVQSWTRNFNPSMPQFPHRRNHRVRLLDNP